MASDPACVVSAHCKSAEVSVVEVADGFLDIINPLSQNTFLLRTLLVDRDGELQVLTPPTAFPTFSCTERTKNKNKKCRPRFVISDSNDILCLSCGTHAGFWLEVKSENRKFSLSNESDSD